MSVPTSWRLRELTLTPDSCPSIDLQITIAGKDALGLPAIARANRRRGIVARGARAAAARPTAPTMAATSRHQHRGHHNQGGTGGAQLHSKISFSGWECASAQASLVAWYGQTRDAFAESMPDFGKVADVFPLQRTVFRLLSANLCHVDRTHD
jgi:hypothetical protein